MPVDRALLSVFDKAGLVDLARGLKELGVELVSSGGTARALSEAGLEVTEVSKVTGSPEMLEGRVKTLHPGIHGPILALRDREEHMGTLEDMGMATIDMVVCNLYPFERAVAEGADLEGAMEMMDIGGPAMIRSAAKNHRDVVVIVSPDSYGPVLETLEKDGDVPPKMRGELAREAILHTASYDIAIHDFLSKRYERVERFPGTIVHRYDKVQKCRYGENKHQEGAFYGIYGMPTGLLRAEKLHGKELSFNNYLDLSDAMRIVSEFDGPTAAVLKHSNPCGVATRENIGYAYKIAFEADSKSAFGGVVGVNRDVDMDMAKAMKGVFIEAVSAPGYEPDALKQLKKKKNIRLMRVPKDAIDWSEPDMKRVMGGMLLQTMDSRAVTEEDLEVVSKRAPTEDEIRDMLFAWKVVRNVKSNAIVLAKDELTVGIGAGQMSRVDSSEIAVKKSDGKCEGAVLASDAFFPFRDAVDAAAENGVTAMIQPGGSIRDQEVIDAVNEYGIAMVFTSIRCFRH